MNELEENIEPKRQIMLLKIILFNNYYAEYLLKIERFKDRINYSPNHLYWSKNNHLVESKNIGFYGFNKNESIEKILGDKQLKPLLISHMAIKAILQNDKRIFEKWALSFDNLSDELYNSISEIELIPKEELEKLRGLIGEINKQEYFF